MKNFWSAWKIRIAKDLGYDLIDHRLELYGKKLKGKNKK